ncbi:MAG: hypothetical protein ABGZ35_13190 [Planctomycetaceae bacterium]|jgi:hypothetical protein
MAAATLSGLLRLAKTSLQIGPWNSSDANAGINEFAATSTADFGVGLPHIIHVRRGQLKIDPALIREHPTVERLTVEGRVFV